jgi:site-specific recombinase XerD
MAQTTPLRRRMLDDMTVRNLSPATQQSYVYAVAKFSRFFDRSPDQLGVEEVRAYQIHLAGLGLSWSHINQVSCALRFFFGVTLGRKDVVDRIVSAKEPKKLPIGAEQRRGRALSSGGAGFAQPGRANDGL